MDIRAILRRCLVQLNTLLLEFNSFTDRLRDALGFGRALTIPGVSVRGSSRLRAWRCPTRRGTEGRGEGGRKGSGRRDCDQAASATGSLGARDVEAGAAAVPSLRGRSTRGDSGQWHGADDASPRSCQQALPKLHTGQVVDFHTAPVTFAHDKKATGGCHASQVEAL